MNRPPWKKDISERVALFRRYYAMANERPLLGFFLGSDYPLHRYSAAASLPQDRPLVPEDFPVAAYLDDSERLWEGHEQCGGDFIWAGTCFWGIPWLEAALGCPIYADHAAGSIHAEPPEGFAGTESIPAFDPTSPWMRKSAEFFEAMRVRSAGRWPLATTRMRGVADLLAALYGGESLVFAMLERPEEVQAAAEKLTDFFIAFGRFQLERIPEYRGGIGSFYYAMWAPKGTVWHQEDAAALLSPELYHQFIEPCDRRIAAAFEHCILHLHPSGFCPIDACLTMDLAAIELHVDTGGPGIGELRATHCKILERRPLLIWGRFSGRELHRLFSGLPGRGLAVQAVVDSPREAEALWDACMAPP